MNTITNLFKRNIRLFFRDRAAVFFSLLSALIVVFLYLLFIAKLYVNGMVDSKVPLDSKEMYFMIYNLVFASIIILNSISIPICALTAMTKDFESKKIDSFLLAPVSPMQLLFSYLLSAFAVTAIINSATWIIGTIFVGIFTGYFLSIETIFLGIVITLLVSLISSMIMSLIVTLVRSSAALNVIGGVAGTFFGFICGIYMPYSNLGNGMKNIGSIFPFTHLTIWFKQIILDNCFHNFELSDIYKEAIYNQTFSASNIGFLGLNLPLPIMLLISGLFAVGSIILATVLLRKRIRKE